MKHETFDMNYQSRVVESVIVFQKHQLSAVSLKSHKIQQPAGDSTIYQQEQLNMESKISPQENFYEMYSEIKQTQTQLIDTSRIPPPSPIPSVPRPPQLKKYTTKALQEILKQSILVSKIFRDDQRRDDIEIDADIELEFQDLRQSLEYGTKMPQIEEEAKWDYNENEEEVKSVQQKTETNIEFKEINHAVFQRGPLIKLANNFLLNKKIRDGIFEDNILKYYANASIPNPKCYFDFSMFRFKVHLIKRPSDYIIMVETYGQSKSVSIKRTLNEDTLQWYQKIKSAIEQGNQQKQYLKPFPKFWKNLYVRDENFTNFAQTGDILLFRGKQLNCKFQRLLTGSQYDHVAIILKGVKDKIYVLEAAGAGVGIFTWDTLRSQKWYELYDKLVIRKLQCERNNRFGLILEQFWLENVGKEYHISMSKLLRNESVRMVKKNFNIIRILLRTYFCSELVAAAYKKLGFLPELKSSTQYWPGSFSNEKCDLQLLNGAKLSDEYVILFNSEQL